METDVTKSDLKLLALPQDDEPADTSETAVDTPLDLHTMRQQNQDREPGPWKLFVEIEMALLAVSVVIGALAFWTFQFE